MKTESCGSQKPSLHVTLIPCPSEGSDIKAAEVPWASPVRTFLRDTPPGPALSPLTVWLARLHGSWPLMPADACLSLWRGLGGLTGQSQKGRLSLRLAHLMLRHGAGAPRPTPRPPATLRSFLPHAAARVASSCSDSQHETSMG